MSDQNLNVRDGWLSDEQMAKARDKSTRTQRTERQLGIGPPWTRDGPNVFYSIERYREWLTANEHGQLKPQQRKRILENA
jgi:hypothetical protein